MDETPFKTSQSIINFASIVNKLCASYSEDKSFTVLAHMQCEEDHILQHTEEGLVTNLDVRFKIIADYSYVLQRAYPGCHFDDNKIIG